VSRLLIATLLLATSVRAADPVDLRPKETLPPGAVIVEFHRFATLDRFRHDLGDIDRRAGKRALPAIRHAYRHVLHGAAIEVADAEAVEAVRRLPYVRAVHPDRVVKMFATPAASAGVIDAASRVNASSLATRGEGVTVGVIDTGIDYMHPALGGGFGPGYKVAGGWDFVAGDADPFDENGHGTHVAGIIAADSAELSGVAPDVTLIAYRVLNGLGQGRGADILAAIDRSVDPNQDGDPSDHLDIINLSLGGLGTADDLASQAVDRATAAGVVVVVAAGNDGGFGTVRSPGAARTAVTVGAIDDAGVVTEFSSRGPSPGSLAMKPDVVAPGLEIVSARLGGGLVAFNGTSMAAPHVAGVAALLVQLHPGWTPSDVKSALITSASPIEAPVYARAAGRVDAAAAASRTTHIAGAGLSFGLASGRTGTWSATRTITLTNHGTTERAFDVVATNLPAGATLTATPAALQLAPGATQSVDLRMDVDNAAAAFPADYAYGGSVELRGTETLKVPWIVVRAGRITARFHEGGDHLVAITASGAVVPPLYDLERAEIFGRPGTRWDLVMARYQPGEDTRGTVQIVAAEDREMTGDDTVGFRGEDATARLTPDGRDAYGGNLNRQSRAARASYLLTLAMHYTKGSRELELGYILGRDTELFMTPLSPSFVVHPIESYFDRYRGEGYNVQHPALHGIAESKTLTTGHSSYVSARLRINEKRKQNYLLAPCLAYGVKVPGPFIAMHSLPCEAWFISDAIDVDYYTTSESGTVVSGTFIGTSDLVIPPLRGIDGAIVPSEFTPSPAAYRIADGERITIGGHASFLQSFFGTNGGEPPRLLYIRTGLTGALGEWQWESTIGTTWTLTSAEGELMSSGTVDSLPGIGPSPTPGARFIAVRDGLAIGGRPSRGELEVRFGAGGVPGRDFRAPSLTTFRAVDSAGRIGDAMRLNDRVTLEFSAADWNYQNNTGALPLKREATRAWYRVTGTSEWLSAQVVLTADDNGSLFTLGRIPAGDVYRAELTGATSVLGGVDVRVEVEDADGHHVTWTQSPAFVVEPPVETTRRRAVRP
jgi:hypothetical protein